MKTFRISKMQGTARSSHAAFAAVISCALFVAGCASPGGTTGQSSYPTTTQRGYGSSYGVVEGIDAVDNHGAANNIGVGTVGGAVVGGLLGNQVGGGRGKAAATVAGAVGGAVVGNRIDQNRGANAATMYDVRVRLDNGSYQTIRQDMLGDIRVGNRVRIEGNRLYRY